MKIFLLIVSVLSDKLNIDEDDQNFILQEQLNVKAINTKYQ